ncbi:hypothetical protein ANCCAN_28016, partial [Ancylostoma caninum]
MMRNVLILTMDEPLRYLEMATSRSVSLLFQLAFYLLRKTIERWNASHDLIIRSNMHCDDIPNLVRCS